MGYGGRYAGADHKLCQWEVIHAGEWREAEFTIGLTQQASSSPWRLN
jgi:hypothetical protein